tara:strand:- start:14327 stop:14875 length:549 start_codon:yes stop_codon:yes gene_type:complete
MSWDDDDWNAPSFDNKDDTFSDEEDKQIPVKNKSKKQNTKLDTKLDTKQDMSCLFKFSMNKKEDNENIAKELIKRYQKLKNPGIAVTLIKSLIKGLAPKLSVTDLKDIDKTLAPLKISAIKKDQAQKAKKKQKGNIKMTNEKNYNDLAADHAGDDMGDLYEEDIQEKWSNNAGDEDEYDEFM